MQVRIKFEHLTEKIKLFYRQSAYRRRVHCPFGVTVSCNGASSLSLSSAVPIGSNTYSISSPWCVIKNSESAGDFFSSEMRGENISSSKLVENKDICTKMNETRTENKDTGTENALKIRTRELEIRTHVVKIRTRALKIRTRAL